MICFYVFGTEYYQRRLAVSFTYKAATCTTSTLISNDDGGDYRPANIPHCRTEREFVSLEQTSQTTCPCFSPEAIRVRPLVESLARGPRYSHPLTCLVFDRMVNDPADQDLIRWSDTGDSFFGGHFLSNHAPNPRLTPSAVPDFSPRPRAIRE